MRIDNKPVASPKITWAECRRERLLFQRLVLVSALEVFALALVVLALVAIVSLVEGDRVLAIRAGIAGGVVAGSLIGFEFLFRLAKRRLGALDEIANGSSSTA